MKSLLGISLVIAGVVFGVWAGIWWALVGGIVQIINELRSPDLSAMVIAYGVVKILFSGLIGWFAGIVLFLPGAALLND